MHKHTSYLAVYVTDIRHIAIDYMTKILQF